MHITVDFCDGSWYLSSYIIRLYESLSLPVAIWFLLLAWIFSLEKKSRLANVERHLFGAINFLMTILMLQPFLSAGGPHAPDPTFKMLHPSFGHCMEKSWLISSFPNRHRQLLLAWDFNPSAAMMKPAKKSCSQSFLISNRKVYQYGNLHRSFCLSAVFKSFIM